MTETGWPSTQTVYECPLPGCQWKHAEPGPDGGIVSPEAAAYLPERTNGSFSEITRAVVIAVDRVLADHLDTHTTVEWVTAINHMREAADRPRRLVSKWRDAARSLESTNALWSSHFCDCANELERTLADPLPPFSSPPGDPQT